jgi:L-histidine Nalpha-methyltransferase
MSVEIAPPSSPPASSHMADEVRRGLLGRPRTLPSKYFYDDVGSALFERITDLPEYYPTRAEHALLLRVADDLVRSLDVVEVAELGAGSSRKTRVLLDAMARADRLERIVLLDVNAAMLSASQRELARRYPGTTVRTVRGDFLDLGQLGHAPRRLLLFLGSTIGNLEPEEARAFLRRAGGVLGPSDAFLVGFDLVKEVAVLESAYNDAQGVTAEFNRNILRVVNAGLGGDFVPDAFDHVAFFDARNSWIEMRLRAREACRVRLPGAELDFRLAPGDEIRTEISCKYTRDSVEALVDGSGLHLTQWHTDGLFALGLLQPVRR